MPGLHLPRLARVPPQMLASFGGSLAARLALDMMDARLLDDRVDARHRTATHVLQAALRRWWSSQPSSLQVLPRLSLHVVEERHGQHDVFGLDAEPGLWVHISLIERDGPARLTLRRRCEALELEHPGLGACAIRTVFQAQRATAQVATPIMIMGLARYVYWQGEDDERSYLEQLRDEDVTDAEVFTREEFRRFIPDWAAGEGRWRRWHPRKRLRGHAAQVLAAIERIECLLKTPALETVQELDQRRDDGSEWVGFAAFARWCAGDCTFRVLDDWAQDAIQVENWETFGSFRLEPGAAGFGTWLRAMPAWLETYGAMDSLLALIAEEDDE